VCIYAWYTSGFWCCSLFMSQLTTSSANIQSLAYWEKFPIQTTRKMSQFTSNLEKSQSTSSANYQSLTSLEESPIQTSQGKPHFTSDSIEKPQLITASLQNILKLLQRPGGADQKSWKKPDAQEQQLELGRELFEEFFKLGIVPVSRAELHSQFTGNSDKQDQVFNEVVNELIRHRSWLGVFVCVYYETRIEFDYCVPALQICTTRSGLQYLLELFNDLHPSLDRVLRSLRIICEEDGGFDQQLKHWIDHGYRMLNEQDKPDGVPREHWWWD
jgi:hypothetical protein